MNNIKSDIAPFLQNGGIDYYGVADLGPAKDFIAEQGGTELSEFPKAITIGIVLLDDLVNRLEQTESYTVKVDYRHHAYDVINTRMDWTTSVISSFLQKEGFRAHPIPASKIVDYPSFSGSFSHKLPAHLAGLGWIGKNCMLITPEHGPRVRWSTVLTDAPLEPTGEPMEQRCGSCMQCVNICPAGAYTGRNFTPEEPREARYDVGLCNDFFDVIKAKDWPPVCGLCLYACPHGRKKKRHSRA